jgi:hypothetical protein
MRRCDSSKQVCPGAVHALAALANKTSADARKTVTKAQPFRQNHAAHS